MVIEQDSKQQTVLFKYMKTLHCQYGDNYCGMANLMLGFNLKCIQFERNLIIW